tara:strand:- start:401 stop:805 length:405 start_codon:yes stop_codon:yes gene_type:complete
MFGLLKIVAKALGGDIIGNMFGGINDHFKDKRELKAAKQKTELQIELVKAKTISTQATADIDKNLLWVKQAETSWKDEAWTIVFICMFISAFFFPERLQAGLAVLATMDEDIKVLMSVVIGSAFGVELYKKLRK